MSFTMIQYRCSCINTSGSGGIDSHPYKLAFLMFFPIAEPPDCTATGLIEMSLEDVDACRSLLAKETSCCDGLSLSSAGLVLEL